MVQLGELMMILELHRQGLSVTAIARRTGRDLLRGNQDEGLASIWMRKCCRMRDGGRA